MQAIALVTPTVAFGSESITTTKLKVVTPHLKNGKKKVITTIDEIKQIAPPERSITSVKSIKTTNLSPQDNVITTGPGNLITTKTSAFTYEGFKSGQIAQTFDGVPITDPFNGGTGGRVNTRADIPITLSQIEGVKVYSGSGTPSQNTTNTLGGTISYQAKSLQENITQRFQ
jgi:iron complex outermembrane receptor protein